MKYCDRLAGRGKSWQGEEERRGNMLERPAIDEA